MTHVCTLQYNNTQSYQLYASRTLSDRVPGRGVFESESSLESPVKMSRQQSSQVNIAYNGPQFIDAQAQLEQ